MKEFIEYLEKHSGIKQMIEERKRISDDLREMNEQRKFAEYDSDGILRKNANGKLDLIYKQIEEKVLENLVWYIIEKGYNQEEEP
jgi:hypothetical protein